MTPHPPDDGRMMNVLLAIPWDDTRGGVISVVDHLARHLTATGHRVLFFHNDGLFFLKDRLTKLGFDGVQVGGTSCAVSPA